MILLLGEHVEDALSRSASCETVHRGIALSEALMRYHGHDRALLSTVVNRSSADLASWVVGVAFVGTQAALVDEYRDW